LACWSGNSEVIQKTGFWKLAATFKPSAESSPLGQSQGKPGHGPIIANLSRIPSNYQQPPAAGEDYKIFVFPKGDSSRPQVGGII